MDLDDLTLDERIVAEHALLTYRAAKQAGRAAPHGQGMAVVEQAVRHKGVETLRKTIELSVSEHAEAQKKGPAARSAPTATR